jgi:hypothetical protein
MPKIQATIILKEAAHVTDSKAEELMLKTADNSAGNSSNGIREKTMLVYCRMFTSSI